MRRWLASSASGCARRSRQVVFYLQDGGACFSAETCAPDSDLYNTTVDEGPTGAGGIFDFADQRNPFADYSVVYVPYCTGDVHLGNTTTEYAAGLTVHHKGFLNATAALDHLAATAPGATEVVVVGRERRLDRRAAVRRARGRSAARRRGSRCSPTDRAPTPTAPSQRGHAAWGSRHRRPGLARDADPTAEQWSVPGLFIQSGHHDPDIVFARHDYAYDETQETLAIVGTRRDLLSLIDANEALIEAAGVDLLSYIAPGDEHTALDRRNLLHRAGQRRAARRLGDRTGRRRTGRGRALHRLHSELTDLLA